MLGLTTRNLRRILSLKMIIFVPWLFICSIASIHLSHHCRIDRLLHHNLLWYTITSMIFILTRRIFRIARVRTSSIISSSILRRSRWHRHSRRILMRRWDSRISHNLTIWSTYLRTLLDSLRISLSYSSLWHLRMRRNNVLILLPISCHISYWLWLRNICMIKRMPLFLFYSCFQGIKYLIKIILIIIFQIKLFLHYISVQQMSILRRTTIHWSSWFHWNHSLFMGSRNLKKKLRIF